MHNELVSKLTVRIDERQEGYGQSVIPFLVIADDIFTDFIAKGMH